jgi:hypothetical protein
MVIASKKVQGLFRKDNRQKQKQKQKQYKSKKNKQYKSKKINNTKVKKRTKKNVMKGGILIDHHIDDKKGIDKLTKYMFFDNDKTNIKGIEGIEDLTIINVNESMTEQQKLDGFIEYVKTHREDNGIYNTIAERLDNKDMEARTKYEELVKVLYKYYDVSNSLTPDILNDIKSKVSIDKKYVFFWDWDRTLSMEEGFLAMKNPQLLVSDYKEAEISNNYDIKIKELDIENYLHTYIEERHNKKVHSAMGFPELEHGLKDGDYVKYLFGGTARIHALVELFKLPNIIHCVISNSISFNLFDQKGKENILLVRAFFNDMGLNVSDQGRILILHCGSKTQKPTGYNKQSFITKAIDLL